MANLELPPVELPVPADRLYAFLADLSRHGEFLDAQDFRGDADSHGYSLDVMGMKLGLDMVAKERVESSRVVLESGARKIFPQVLTFAIEPNGAGSVLRLRDEADIPMAMAMMGADRILKGQLERSLARIQELAAAGAI